MMARQSAAQSGKRGFQASLRSTFRRGRQITTMRAIRQEGPPPDLGGEEPKKTPPPPGHAAGEPDDGRSVSCFSILGAGSAGYATGADRRDVGRGRGGAVRVAPGGHRVFNKKKKR